MAIPYSVSGKLAVITGGGSGIGLAFAKVLHKNNAHVVIGDIALTDDAREFLNDTVQTSNSRFFFQCDVTKWAQLDALLDFAEERFGRIPDIYVPCAGIAEPKSSNFWIDAPEDDGYLTVDVNVNHPIKFTRMAIRRLYAERKEGVVLTVASMAGYTTAISMPLYTATKFAVVGFSRCMEPLENLLGIRVVCVAPGPIKTPLWSTNPDVKSLVEDVEFISAEECAEAMLYAVEKNKGGSVFEIRGPDRRIVPLYGNQRPGTVSGKNIAMEDVTAVVLKHLDMRSEDKDKSSISKI